MELALAITTASRGENYYDQCVRSLVKAGFTQAVVAVDGGEQSWYGDAHWDFEDGCVLSCNNRQSIGPWPNFLHAMRLALADKPDAAGVMVVQDDVIVAKGLRGWLDKNLWPGLAPLCGVVSVYCAGANVERGRPGWWYYDEGDLPSKPYGACCVILERKIAERLLANPPGHGGRTKTDIRLGKFCKDSGRRYWTHTPSLAQHIGKVSTLEYADTRPWEGVRCASDFVEDVRELEEPSPCTQ